MLVALSVQGVAPAVAQSVVTGLPAAAAAPYVFTVTSTGDEDDVAGDGACRTRAGTCTLRAAITESTRQTSTPVVIRFALPGSGPFTITPQTRLPILSNPAGVTIDGYTQAGAAANTSATASNAVLRVALAGTGPTGIDGLFITSPNNVVRGLSVYDFRHNVWIYGTAAGNNAVVGSFIGTDPTGTKAATHDQAGASGITVQAGAWGSRIGGSTPADRNVISGNYQNGVATYDSPTRGTVVQGNLIGLNPAGTARLANRSHGIDINTGTRTTLVGGTAPGAGNVLSGNLREGVQVSHGTGTTDNDIVGNLIGADPTGTGAPAYAANDEWGVRLEGAGTCAPCGVGAGPSLVQDNTIVSSGKGGVLVDKGFHDATIRDNRIGVLANSVPAGNLLWGVRVAQGARRIQVGPGNVLAHNQQGIQVDSAGVSPLGPPRVPTDARITRNSIYANRAGVGIDLSPLGAVNRPGTGDPTVNGGLVAPELGARVGLATAYACPLCTVEVYAADRGTGAPGAGRRFLGSATADRYGYVVLGLDPGLAGTAITATATDPAGRTSEFADNVAVPSPRPGNQAPVVGVTADCVALTCIVRGSYADPDTIDGGAPQHIVIDYGDGSTGGTSHTYEQPGTYVITYTAWDQDGASGSATLTVRATAPPTTGLYDTFDRTGGSGWTTYQQDRGDWTHPNGTTGLSKDGDGLMLLPGPGSTRLAMLPGVRGVEADVTAALRTDTVPSGYGAVVSLLTRNVARDTSYRSRLRLSGGGGLYLGAARARGGSETSVGPEVPVPGLRFSTGTRYVVRTVVTGTYPTTLRLKAYVDGTPEPDWQLTVTDAEPALQAAGSTGVSSYLSTSMYAGPVLVRFDRVLLRAGPPPAVTGAGG